MIILKYFYLIYATLIILLYRPISLLFSKRYWWQTRINDRIFLWGYYFIPTDYHYIKKHKIDIVIDLTSEFPKFPWIFKKMGVKYYEFPTYDNRSVGKNNFKKIKKLYEQYKNKRFYINCAMWHWRSASITWWLLVECHWYGKEEAEDYLLKIRSIGIKNNQKDILS